MYSAYICVCVFIHICIVITLEYLIIIDNYTFTIIILRILSENIVFVVSKNLLVTANKSILYSHLLLKNYFKIQATFPPTNWLLLLVVLVIVQKLKFNQPSVQFSSVAQSCPTLCDPMNRSMPGLPVHHQLPEFTQSHPSSQ